MEQISKRQFAVSALWKILESFSSKGISMIVSIVLARLLLPSDYGMIALTAVFTNLSDILIDGGLSTALIRKENVDEYDYSAVFSVSSFLSVVLYIILFLLAPFVSGYYNEPNLTLVLRVTGLTFFIQAFSSVRNGIINRNMQFKLLFLCNAIASAASGIIGIVTAYFGFGVWALVAQRLSQQIILTAMLLVKVKWKVRWRFDLGRIKQMLSFSVSVVGASLLNYLSGSISSAVIGKKYSVTDLGYLDKGEQLPKQLSLYTFGSMSSVLLPTISSCQSDLGQVKHIIRKVVVMTSFLIMPMMAGLAVTSREIICVVFTEKWLPSAPIIPYMCLYYLTIPYTLINSQIFIALGRSKLYVKIESIKFVFKTAGLVVFVFVLKCTMLQWVLASDLIAVAITSVTFFEVRKLIQYSVHEVVKDLSKPFCCTTIMIFAVIGIATLTGELSNILSFLIKTSTGVVVYLVASFLCKSEGIDELISFFKKK